MVYLDLVPIKGGVRDYGDFEHDWQELGLHRANDVSVAMVRMAGELRARKYAFPGHANYSGSDSDRG